VERQALERVSRAEAKNSMTLAYAHEDAKVFARKVTLLEDELTAERRAQEVSKREHQEQFKELTLLQTRGSAPCHAIIDPPWVRHHLSKGMCIATLCHSKMAGELATLQAAVSIATESVLGHSPSNTFRGEVVSELAAEF
jgi:hypothetical protein